MGFDKQPPNKLRGGNYKKMAEPFQRGRCTSRCQPSRSCLPRLGASRSNHHYPVNKCPWGGEWERESWEDILGSKKEECKNIRKAVPGWTWGPSRPASFLSRRRRCMISQGYEKCAGIFSRKLSKPSSGCSSRTSWAWGLYRNSVLNSPSLASHLGEKCSRSLIISSLVENRDQNCSQYSRGEETRNLHSSFSSPH